MRTPKIKSSTDKCVFRYRMKRSVAPLSFRLLPSTVPLSELCSTSCLQRARQLSEAGRSRRVFVGWALNFRVRVLLKGAVVFLSRTRSSKRLFAEPFQIHHKNKSLGLGLLWFFCSCLDNGNNIHLVDFHDIHLSDILVSTIVDKSSWET